MLSVYDVHLINHVGVVLTVVIDQEKQWNMSATSHEVYIGYLLYVLIYVSKSQMVNLKTLLVDPIRRARVNLL